MNQENSVAITRVGRAFAWVGALAGLAVLLFALLSGSSDWWAVLSDVTALWMGAALFTIVTTKSRATIVYARAIALVLMVVLAIAMVGRRVTNPSSVDSGERATADDG